MEKMVNLFFLLGFNYLMFKYWGTQKVTLLTVIGNYFFICILGTYNLWRKSKAGTLTDYEKRGWRLIRTLDVLIIISVLLLLSFFLFIKYF